MLVIQTFLVPLLWTIPLIVALVNYAKVLVPKLPATYLPLIAAVVGCLVVVVAFYFGTMPEWGRVVVAGLAIGLSASGVWDLTKMFGTIVSKE